VIAARIAAVGLALLAALLAAQALRTGAAGLHGRIAQDALVRLEAGREVAPAERAAARLAADASQRLAPRDGAAHEWRARLALREAALARDAAERRTWRAAAREAAARAREARPRWPYAALLQAAAEADDLRTGPVFAAAVADAWGYGRHERRVVDGLALLWLRLEARDAAPELALAWDAALARGPEDWIDRADRAGSGPEACARAAGDARARARCEVLGWTAGHATGAAGPG
jgi:hypothetical protein